MRYLAVDLGSSFIKGAVLDLDALTIEHIERVAFPPPIRGLSPWFREFDPHAIVATTRALLEKLLAGAPDAAGVVMCSQLHGLVFTDERGRAVSNLINWQDERALQPFPGGEGTYFDEINRRLTRAERRQLGNEARPGVPLCYLFWLAQNDALPSDDAIAASLANFVVANLCDCPPVSDVTNAFAHGAFDVETLDWHRSVIEKLGLATVRWPEIVPPGAVIGKAGSACACCRSSHRSAITIARKPAPCSRTARSRSISPPAPPSSSSRAGASSASSRRARGSMAGF